MPLPALGGFTIEEFEANWNDLNVRKFPVVAAFIRDYNGAHTSLADPAVGLNAEGRFSPFGLDGEPRDDLLIYSTMANLGFYDLGKLAPEGHSYTPEVTQVETMTAQSRRSARIDITREDDRLRIRARESTPLTDALRDNKPLAGLKDLGAIGYDSPKPASGRMIERQIIAWGFDGNEYAAKVFPRMARTDVGETSWNLDNPDDLDITYTALLCPYAKYPVNTLREGGAWRAKGGFPNFGLIAPVAAPAGPTGATLTHAVPTGIADPFTYVVKKSVTPFTTYTTATVGSSNPVGGNIVHTITGLTAVSTKFKVEATGSNGLTGTSSESNAVTPA